MSVCKPSSNINRLKVLVDELSDRDTQMRKDHDLFEDFFENFPLPVTIWSVTKEHAVVSQRGNDFACRKATTLDEMFQCPTIKKASLKYHELALGGKKVDYMVTVGDNVYYAKLVPSFDDNGGVVGVTGIAWNVTSNATMLTCVEQIAEATAGRRGGYKQIHEIANKALATSRFKLLADSLGDSSDE
jgi:hypothetical protein